MASICDGTTHQQNRNCRAPARWLVRLAQSKGSYRAACDRHLGQVGVYLLDGEQGALEVQHIHTREGGNGR